MARRWIGVDRSGYWLFDKKPEWNHDGQAWEIPGDKFRGSEVCEDAQALLKGILPEPIGCNVNRGNIVELEITIVKTGKVQEMVRFEAAWSDDEEDDEEDTPF